MLGQPLDREEPDRRDLLETGAEHEQRAEHEHRDQHDDRADATQQRVERCAEQRAQQTARLLQRFERVAARAPVADVQQADDGRADEDDPEPEPHVTARLSRFPPGDEHAARGDEQRERHDHAARAEHDRRGGVDAVADRAREVRVDPEALTSARTNRPIASASVEWPPSWRDSSSRHLGVARRRDTGLRAVLLRGDLRRAAVPRPLLLRLRLGAVVVLRRVAAIGGQP